MQGQGPCQELMVNGVVCHIGTAPPAAGHGSVALGQSWHHFWFEGATFGWWQGATFGWFEGATFGWWQGATFSVRKFFYQSKTIGPPTSISPPSEATTHKPIPPTD
jgi:hypothetical protein